MSSKSAKLIILWLLLAIFLSTSSPGNCQILTLQELVTPSTVLRKDGNVVRFAVHGFVEFRSLAELFPYMEFQGRRWPSNSISMKKRGRV